MSVAGATVYSSSEFTHQLLQRWGRGFEPQSTGTYRQRAILAVELQLLHLGSKDKKVRIRDLAECERRDAIEFGRQIDRLNGLFPFP